MDYPTLFKMIRNDLEHLHNPNIVKDTDFRVKIKQILEILTDITEDISKK